MNISIKVIPHKDQKYETCGNWGFENGDLWIEVSQMSDWRHEILIAIHELVESILCKQRNIKEKDVTKFDIQFEKKRKKGDESEPGDDFYAPYWKEHQEASGIERIMAALLEVNWQSYEKEFERL